MGDMTDDQLAMDDRVEASYPVLVLRFERGDSGPEGEWVKWSDYQRLLAHIDALTAKVEGLPVVGRSPGAPAAVNRAAVLAILRGDV